MSVKQHKNTKKGKGKRSKDRQQTGTISLDNYRVPKRVLMIKDIVPVRLVTKLKYLYNRTLTNIGFNTASTQLNANGCFDVDPSLGSPSMPGFGLWMTFYQRYRPLQALVKCTFGNRETFPVIANLGFDTQNYAANTKGISWFDGKNQKTCLIPPVTGGSIKTLTMSRHFADVVGDDVVMDDDLYAGFATANPSSLVYCSAAVSSEASGGVFATGVVARYELEVMVEFFQPRNFQA